MQASNLKAPIDVRVKEKIGELVRLGITSVLEVQHHLQLHIKAIFGSRNLPDRTNRRFFPSRTDVRSLMYRERLKQMQGLIDEDIVKKKISDWKEQNAEDKWFFRSFKQVDSTENSQEADDEVAINGIGGFLIVYQAEWQRRLLSRYGNNMCFLDATYKTTGYALPLFFLCVKTNVGYSVVATFIVQSENAASVAEGLQIIKDWNSMWEPQSFMADGSEAEHNAIKSVFPC